MKHLLILLSILLLSSPLFGQSKKSGLLYIWENGSRYVGEWKDGKKHGQGTYTSGKGVGEGDKYVGEFKSNKYHGQGMYTYSNGDKYVGEYKDDKEHGQGTFTWSNGNKYMGEFKDGKKHGQGTFTYSNEKKYVGEWKNGKQNGQGTLTFPDGRNGVGEWRENKPWNITEYNKNGNITGKYVNGLKVEKRRKVVLFEREVDGVLGWYENGDEREDTKFVGEIKNGKQNGEGTQTYPDGRKYVGGWKMVNGVKVEKGILFRDTPRSKWEEGGEKWFRTGDEKTQAIYEGEIVTGVPGGQGTITFPSGSTYVGEFRDGKRTGQGTMTYSDGGKYEGKWKDGKQHGQGTFTFTDGRKWAGEFRGNKPWNLSLFDKKGNINMKWVNGKKQ